MRPVEQVWLAVEPVDMRLGADGLSRIVQQALGGTPGSGHAYAFRNRQGNRVKLIMWDGSGVWLCQRRLHQGRFTWPESAQALFTLSAQQWQWLTCGVDWRRLSAQPQADWLC